jgi:hypothetical protein
MVSSVPMARKKNGLQKCVAAPMASLEEVSQGFEGCKVESLVDLMANTLAISHWN